MRQNLDKIITTDEKLFHLSHGAGKSKFFYKKPGDKSRSFAAYRDKGKPKSVMVWGGVSKNGKTELIFVQPGVKIGADYYINQVLKPLKQDMQRLYPDGSGILQQDSAPAHTSKKTIEFLKNEKINYIPPDLWTPNSPDNVPMDYCIWSWMVTQLNRRRISTLVGLKRALKEVWNSIPQELIDRTLDSWPKRSSLIHKNKGDNIEHIWCSKN